MNFVDIYQKYWKNGYTLTDLSLSGIDRELFRSLFNPVAEVFRKYPAGDVHLYIPGVGQVNGLQPDNYFDSAGTTLASVDGSVGLVLDAAGSVGAELAGTGFTNTTGWAYASGAITASSAGAYSTIPAVGFGGMQAGKTYRITATVVVTSGSVKYQFFGTSGQYSTKWTSSGQYSELFVASEGKGGFSVQADSAGFTGSVTGISVREVTGIHATQSTPGYKPTLRKGIVNLLTWSSDLTNAVWSIRSTGATATSNSVSFTTDPSSRVLHTYTHIPGAATIAASFSVADVGKTVRLAVWDSVLDGLNTGKSGALIIPASGVVVFNITLSGGAGYVGVVGDATPVTLSNPSVAIFAGTLTAAQILAAGGIPLTTTAPASSQAGVNYLEFDGVDDRLSLGGPLFQMADDHCVVVGFQPKVLSAYRSPFFPAANAATSARIGVIGIDPGGSLVAYYTNDAGVFFSPTLGSVVAGESFVASVRKVGAQFKGRKNGGTWSATQTPTGTYTLDTASIGNGTGFGAALGNCYPIIAIKGTVSDSDLAVLEKFVAQLSGVTL